jgi:pimeloyl-ACP methyl ester carboxylesterase
MADESSFLEIARCTEPSRACDIVFVHGLNGHSRETWELPKPTAWQRLWRWLRRQKQDSSAQSLFWPDLIAQEFPNAGVWSLGYPAASTAWRGHAMPLTDRARNILQLCHLKGLGKRPLIFIVHSLGGLLAKQILLTAYTQNNPAWQSVGKSVKGILFLATPHSGAFLASVVDVFRVVSRANWTIADLQPHEPHLRDLNEWFRENFVQLGLRAHVVRETKLTSGLMVVDATSADPGIASVRVIPVDKDHINICKPVSRSDQVFLEARQFIADCIAVQHRGSGSTGTESSGLPTPKRPVKRRVPQDRIDEDDAEETTR